MCGVAQRGMLTVVQQLQRHLVFPANETEANLPGQTYGLEAPIRAVDVWYTYEIINY